MIAVTTVSHTPALEHLHMSLSPQAEQPLVPSKVKTPFSGITGEKLPQHTAATGNDQAGLQLPPSEHVPGTLTWQVTLSVRVNIEVGGTCTSIKTGGASVSGS